MLTDIHIRLDAEQTKRLDALRAEERTRPSRNAYALAIVREALEREMHPPMRDDSRLQANHDEAMRDIRAQDRRNREPPFAPPRHMGGKPWPRKARAAK